MYERFEHALPIWFREAKLGILVHWGPYSVPAWAEPIGEFGNVVGDQWLAHNAYAEWYFNTIRIEGSPARSHHLAAYGGMDYRQFLDIWDASAFNAADLMALVRRVGARYFIPTTKHHDGITLWDAPGTGISNTVQSGPRRDFVDEMKKAATAEGIKFGTYYSGGLDWAFSPDRPIFGPGSENIRPISQQYADYAFDQVADLISRYKPDILWGDIDWPDAGKLEGAKSLSALFDLFYSASPDGVVNDRWGITHWDFRTSEYKLGREDEAAEAWENTRGIGYSFGYNRLETAQHTLRGPDLVRHFVDVVSRGGNLLLNVGLMADGAVPPLQANALNYLADFNTLHGDALFASTRPAQTQLVSSEEPWIRWTATRDAVHAFIFTDAERDVSLPCPSNYSQQNSAFLTGTGILAVGRDRCLLRTLDAPSFARVTFPREA